MSRTVSQGVSHSATSRTTIITTQPQPQQLSDHGKLGPGPTGLKCMACDRPIVTRVNYTSTSLTHIVATALCVICGCCCGCCIPYCMKSCKVANHYCPECKAFLGTYVPS